MWRVRDVVGKSRLEGRLLDDGGGLVVGATVTFDQDDVAPTVSGEDGRFVVEGLAEGRYAITAKLQDLYVATRIQTGRANDIAMERRGLVQVLVRDGDTPIAGAAITWDDQVIATTNASGIAFVLGGENRKATVSAYGYVAGPLSMHANENPPGIRHVVLERGQGEWHERKIQATASLAVSVVDEHGQPCEAFIYIEDAERLARTDANGQLTIEGVDSGRRIVYATTEDRASRHEAISFAWEQRVELVLALEANRAIAGIVRDTNGLPVVDARVSAGRVVPRKASDSVDSPCGHAVSGGRAREKDQRARKNRPPPASAGHEAFCVFAYSRRCVRL